MANRLIISTKHIHNCSIIDNRTLLSQSLLYNLYFVEVLLAQHIFKAKTIYLYSYGTFSTVYKFNGLRRQMLDHKVFKESSLLTIYRK